MAGRHAAGRSAEDPTSENPVADSIDPRTGLPAGARVDAPYEYAGAPDCMQRLWTPHRMTYITSGDRPPTDGSDPGEGEGSSCPFCRAPHKSDEDALIVRRGKTAFVILNLYPYNGGHLLVCPYRHVPQYTDVTDQEREEIGLLTQQAMRVLAAVGNAQGFNIGMNQGIAGGAGIAAHLHQHVVPRYIGDANFMPIIGRTKAVPQLLGDFRELMATRWEEYADADYGEGSSVPAEGAQANKASDE